MQAELEAIIGRFGADTGTIHLLENGVLMLKAHAGGPGYGCAYCRTGSHRTRAWPGLPPNCNEPVSTCNIQSDNSRDVNAGGEAQTGVGGAIVVPIRNGLGDAVRCTRDRRPPRAHVLCNRSLPVAGRGRAAGSRRLNDPKGMAGLTPHVKFLAALLAVSAFAADVPRTWEKSAVETLELPPGGPELFPGSP